MVSMISFIVVLLAAYAYSAPVVTDVQNATLIMEVENATMGFHVVDVTIPTRRGVSDEFKNKHGNVTVGLSSSEESDSNETTQTNKRQFEEPSTSETDMKRDADSEVESFESSTVVDETSDHIENAKRSFDNQPWLAAQSNDVNKRSVEFTESSTVVDETSDHIEHAKRSFDNQPWLAAESNDVNKRSVEFIESSTDIDETSTVEDGSVPSTSEISHTNRGFGEISSMTTEASEAFNRRAIGSVESVEAGESSTVIVIKVQPESTTEEQSISSTVEPIPTTEFSSTSDYETTAIPAEEFTTVESVPTATTSKILAIIPGTISRTQIAVQPVEQEKLNQVRNQTIVETIKPNY